MANYIKGTKIQENSISETKLDSSLQSWKETVTNHINNNDNPHNITKSSIGLDNVTNDAQVKRSELGVANGVATLDSTGKVPSGQLPSYVDDVIEGYLYNGVFYKDTSYTTSIVGESGKIYIDLPTNKTYRWTGSVYGVISETIALGETPSTAYRGDRGKIAYDHSQSAHAPSNAQANVIETIKVNGTALTPNSKAVDITIPTVGNGTITIKQGGTSKGTFTTNQNGNTTIELTDTNTTYTAGDGLSLSGTTFSNNGVRSIATGTTNGTISVNTNGNISNVGVYGLKSAAYTNSSDYAAASHTHSYLPLSGGTLSGSDRTLLRLKSSNSLGPIIAFHNPNADSVASLGHIPSDTNYGTFLNNEEGRIGLLLSNDGVAYLTTNTNYLTKNYTILHSGNYNSYALPLSGGMIRGTQTGPLNINTTATEEVGMRFYMSGSPKAWVGYAPNIGANLFVYSNHKLGLSDAGVGFLDSNTIIHSGNFNSYAPKLDGTGASGTWGISISGNADTLDGYHADSFTKKLYLGTTDLNSIDDSLLGQQSGNANATTELHYPVEEAGGLISILSTYNSTNQIYGTYRTNRWFARGAGTGLSSRTSWREFAFTDSNVASATKLQNSRTIWGQSFDGTGNVSGPPSFPSIIDINRNAITGALIDSSKIGFEIETFANDVRLKTYSASVGNPYHLVLTSNGNVGIGTTSPSYKLHVAGSTYLLANKGASEQPTLGNVGAGSHTLIGTDSYGLEMWSRSNGNFGMQVHRFDGTATAYNLLLQPLGGNVGIGIESPSHKLHVVGDGYFTENVITESDFSSRGNAIIDGRVGIGTSSPAYNLDVDGNMRITGPIRLNVPNSNEKYYISTEYNGLLGITYEGRYQNPAFLMNNLGYVYLNCENPVSPAYPLVVNGTISCTTLLQTSDIKYKTNIKQIEYEEALKIIENLNPVTWDWNENTKISGSSSGFVAQEAEEFIPNAISRDSENNLSLDYTQLHSYEIRVIQEQQKEIKDLKQRLEVLESLVLQLTNREI